MQCPRCRSPLVASPLGGITVDACGVCRGAFYEHSDAAALDPDAEIRKLVTAGSAKMKGKSTLPCPLGHGPLITYDCEAPDQHRAKVEIETCPTCKGIWLDAEEAHVLQKIAAQTGDAKSGVGWYLLQAFTGIPLEVYHPVKRRPVGVFLIILACIAVFGVELSYAAADGLEWFIRRFGLVPNEVMHGRQLWSIVSHMFMHGGFGHIFGNLVYLYIFGDNIEDKIGRIKFLILYFICGLFAAGAQIAAGYNSTVPMVGASGAIAGILGAYLILFPRVRVYVVVLLFRFKVSVWFYLGGWIAMNLLMGGAAALDGAEGAGGVAWWAHIGGFAAGGLWALVMRRRILAT